MPKFENKVIRLNMRDIERKELLRQVMWDYNIPIDDIDALVSGQVPLAGHYTREQLFKKILETFPWYTVMNIFPLTGIKLMLTEDLISSLKSQSLKRYYEYVRTRLQETVSDTG